uniref:Membrane protein, palmitoylated 7b (MAGUK p55 subfamily member 7) n=1 Tax=Sinocyclocheilus rhinocerous TaxID=307959 RepID=A0A673NR16_9TELE
MKALSFKSGAPLLKCRLLASLLYGLESHMDTSEDSTFLQDMLMGNTLHLLIKMLHSDIHIHYTYYLHDMVSQKEFDPRLPPLHPLPDYIEKEEYSIKIVRLVKNQESLGATIKRDESTGAIVVARVMRGGAADRSGLIHEGDKLKEVNGVPMEDKNPEEIIPILAKSEGAVTFKVIPGTKEEPETIDNKIFVRALFDYNPQEDPAIPCKDAGLEFWRGDVLQIVSQEDDTWWQARRHGDANLRAGLIPSRQLQERRVTLQRPAVLFHPLRESIIFGAGLRKSFRLSRKDSTGQHVRQKMGKGHAGIHLPIYQEVLPYKRKPDELYRLVLLTGPSGVGVTELKRRLLLSDPEHFSVSVPYTTRQRKRHEREGVEYHFVSKHTFEKEILNHKFLEYGEYKGNYYGMSLDSVRRVVAESKVCLLDVKPHVTLYTSELKPYVIFVKPPSIESLRLSRRKAKVLSSQNEQTPTKIFTVRDIMIVVSCQICLFVRFSGNPTETHLCHAVSLST